MTALTRLLARLAAGVRWRWSVIGDDLRRPPPAPATPRRVLVTALVLGLAIGCFNQLGAPLRASHAARITADEPFYLLTTVSLLEDGDLDLTNDYALRRYRAFFDHPQELWQQSVPTEDGRLLSPHNVGTSLLVLPAYAAGGLDGVKRFLGALGGITAALMLLLAYRSTGNLAAALAAATLVAVSAPLFVYSTQIYPEAPSALILAACLWLLLGQRPGWRSALLVALGLNSLAWLGIKYALVGSTLALLGIVRFAPRARLLLLALLAPSAGVYIGFHLATYGGLTPYTVNRVYAGSDTVQLVGLHLELWNRLYRIAGLWIDGEFGLVRWAPVLLLTLPALPLLSGRAGPVRWVTPAIFGVQLLVAVFLSITMRGWWFPGRMLIVVLPLLVIPLAQTLAMVREYPLLAGLAALLGGASAGITLALRGAVAVEQVVLAVDPFALPWPPFQALAGAFPVYTTYQASTWLLTAAWALVACALGAMGFRLRVRGAHLCAKRTAPVRNAAVPHGALMTYTVIVGGGPAGLAAAYRLSRYPSQRMLLLERAPVLGGLAAGFRYGDYTLDFGPHRLHAATDPGVLADLRRLLGDELEVRPRSGRIRLAGKYLPYPVGPATVLGLGPRRIIQLSAGLLAAQIAGSPGAAVSYEDALQARLGEPLYRLFYGPYAEKVWGLPGSQIAADQAERRVNQRGLADLLPLVLGRGAGHAYLYPRGGFGRIPAAYAEALASAPACQMECSTTVETVEWHRERGRIHALRFGQDGDTRKVSADHLIWTAPLPELIRRLDPPAPADILQAAARLRQRAVVLCYVVLARPCVGRADTYYFPERHFPFNRVTEQKNFSGDMIPPDRTVLCMDLACDPDDALFLASDEKLREHVLPALAEAGLARPEQVIEVFSRRFRQAYPLYDLGYAAAIQQVLDWLARFQNLWVVGRQGLFLHNNTHHSLLMGYRAADAIAMENRGGCPPICLSFQLFASQIEPPTGTRISIAVRVRRGTDGCGERL